MKVLFFGVGAETLKIGQKSSDNEFYSSAKAMGKNVAECDMIIVTERQGHDYLDTLVNAFEDFEDQCSKYDVDCRPIVLFISESLDQHINILRRVYGGYTFYSSDEVKNLSNKLVLHEFEYDVSFLKD